MRVPLEGLLLIALAAVLPAAARRVMAWIAGPVHGVVVILTVLAIPGAFWGGRLDDRLGSKRTVQLAIAGVIIASIGLVSVSADRVLFVMPAGG